MDLIEQLAAHSTLGSVPRAELDWLATHGTSRLLEVGDVLSARTRPVEGMFIIFSGRIALFVDRGGNQQKAIEWRGGDVSACCPTRGW